MALNSVQAVLTAIMNRLQDLEVGAFSLLTPLSDVTLNAISGDLLDKIGARVGESRQNRGDADYRVAIRIRIRVNRSRGNAEDVLQVAVLASANSTPKYYEFANTPATFEVDITNLPSPVQVARLLAKTKAGGTLGLLVYSIDALDAFEWGDATDATNANTAEQWADSVGNTGPAWPSGVAMTSS